MTTVILGWLSMPFSLAAIVLGADMPRHAATTQDLAYLFFGIAVGLIAGAAITLIEDLR